MSLYIFEPGDIIQSKCKPLYKTVNYSNGKGKICNQCFTSGGSGSRVLYPCPGCFQMFYCSRNCRTLDWKEGHNVECDSPTFHNILESDLKRHLFRAMAFFAVNPDMTDARFKLYDGSTRCFNDLLSHMEHFKNTSFYPICQELAQELSKEHLNTGDVSADALYFLKLAGIFQTNAFTIYDESETTELGSGIYIAASVFNHACRPNAVFCSTGTLVEIRAIAPIRKGEAPCISYLDKNACRKERQWHLKRFYNFDCLCDRCEEEDKTEEGQVDFVRLNKLINQLKSASTTARPTCLSRCSTTQNMLLDAHEEIVGLMTRIYNKFDSRITNQYSRTLYAVINNSGFQLSPRLEDLIRETRGRLQISCGEHHSEFKKFERTISVNTRTY